MLPPEIAPFADHHIRKLTEIRDALEKDGYAPNEDVIQTLTGAINGYERFKICMIDETKQKKRYADIARDHRLHCKE